MAFSDRRCGGIVISPIAVEVVRRIDALFDIERDINGQSADRRKATRQEVSAPLVTDLKVYMLRQRDRLSRGHDLTKAMNYILKRWDAFTLFLEDGNKMRAHTYYQKAA